jgi:hypothetical protein
MTDNELRALIDRWEAAETLKESRAIEREILSELRRTQTPILHGSFRYLDRNGLLSREWAVKLVAPVVVRRGKAVRA